MRLLALAITMITLTGCITPPSGGQSERTVELIELSSSGVRSLKNAVRDGLKDPSSAQFGPYIAFNVKKADGTTTMAACGYVNAKNSYGGYVGMTPYNALGIDNGFVSATVNQYAMSVCQRMYGVSI